MKITTLLFGSCATWGTSRIYKVPPPQPSHHPHLNHHPKHHLTHHPKSTISNTIKPMILSRFTQLNAIKEVQDISTLLMQMVCTNMCYNCNLWCNYTGTTDMILLYTCSYEDTNCSNCNPPISIPLGKCYGFCMYTHSTRKMTIISTGNSTLNACMLFNTILMKYSWFIYKFCSKIFWNGESISYGVDFISNTSKHHIWIFFRDCIF